MQVLLFAENDSRIKYECNQKNSGAAITRNNIKNADATTDYLKAILNARLGKNADAATALKAAISKDSSFAKYAENDIELKNVSK